MALAELIYTTLLKPKPLRIAANAALRTIVRPTIHRHGSTIVLNPRDPVVSGALTLGVYENDETEFFIRACRPGYTVLDIGANCGYYTALAMVRVGPSGRVIALEPDVENFQFLERTVASNPLARAACIRKAAGPESGTRLLFTSADNRGDNRMYDNSLSSKSYEVETVRVDDLGVASFDLIKIDVQGFEGHVFAGMRRILAESPNLIVLTEFWPDGLRQAGSDPMEVIASLRAAGLTLFELGGAGKLAPLPDPAALIERLPGRKYTNLVATKDPALLPPELMRND